jgi:hypothetical protein
MHLIPDITVGNLITLLVIVIGFIVTWTRQDMRIRWLEDWAKKHQEWSEKEHEAFEELRIAFARYNSKGK